MAIKTHCGLTLALLVSAVCFQARSATALEAYLDRNYYTTESAAHVLTSVAIGKAEIRDRELRVSAALRDENGAMLVAEAAMGGSAEAALAIPLREVPVGQTSLVVELRDSRERLLGRRTLALRKHRRAPDRVNDAKIDQQNHALLVRGEPFFPIGIWTGQLSDEWLRLYKEIGFNTLLLWQGDGQDRPVAEGLEQLDRLDEHGLRAIVRPLTYVESYGGLRRSEGLLQGIEEMREELKAIRRHPAVLAYYGIDEAPEHGLDEGLAVFLSAAREIAPYHPVYISGSTPSRLDRYDFADILGRHSYWCPMGAPPQRTPNRPARVCKWTYENVTEPNHRPLFFVPQAETTSHSRRALTPAERRVTVYLGLIQGAKSILFFRAPIVHRATAESMRSISAEIKAIAPALLGQRVPQEIVVAPAPSFRVESPSAHRYDLPIVQALLADHPQGESLLLAANSSSESLEAAWDLRTLGPELRVSDFFTRKTRPVDSGILRDHFPGYGTRVYLIAGASRRAGEKVVIRAALAGPAVKAATRSDDEIPEPEGKNMILNSSFEEAALPGWPDSWWFGEPTPHRMAGDPHGPGQDCTVAFHGSCSLRIVNPGGGSAGRAKAVYRHRFASTGLRGGIPVQPGKPYVFSAYMRAEEGTRVELNLCNYAYNSWRYHEGVQDQFMLTGDWKRYEAVVMYPEKGWSQGHRPDLGVVIRHRGGTSDSIWVDAVQLEEGETATPYEP